MKRLIGISAILAIIGVLVGWYYYSKIFHSIVDLPTSSHFDLFIEPNSDFSEVVQALESCDCITNMNSFKWVSEQKKYPELVKPGRYKILPDMTANDLVNKLRSGDQDAIKVTFTGVRTVAELCEQVAGQILLDSAELTLNFYDQDVIKSKGFNQETFRSMFIPNTYEMWWNSNSEAFVARMAAEYKKFWTAERVGKAAALGLSQSECSTLASIVKAETAKTDEAPQIAALYLNRIRIGMALQADPTLIYALGDFSVQRVLDIHKEINSPYNTYRFAGLPPGPINFPEPVYIDAVLNAPSHNFLYMCAKPDFSGYHNFAQSYNQHLVYARKYQQALDKRGIYK